MMKKSSRSLIFMGDFYFLFYIVLLENINKLNYLGIYISAILMAISILGISYFLYFISKMKDFQKIERTVQSLDDRTNLYVMYMISFISLIPLFTGGYPLVQYLVFGVILLVIYSIYINSDLLFYNPLLGLIGYRYVKITTKEGSEIFIIASKDEEIQIGDKLSIYMLTDYIYYLP